MHFYSTVRFTFSYASNFAKYLYAPYTLEEEIVNIYAEKLGRKKISSVTYAICTLDTRGALPQMLTVAKVSLSLIIGLLAAPTSCLPS